LFPLADKFSGVRIRELGKFEGRKFIYKEPLRMPDGAIIRWISVSEAKLESEIKDEEVHVLDQGYAGLA